VKSETHNVKTVRHRMMTNKSVERLHVQQERVADCGYVGLQAFVAMVGPICKQVHCVESWMEHYWELCSKNAQNIKAL